jgi:hypothetical protein
MLRICLFGRPNRRIQPERYAPFVLKFVEKDIDKIKLYGILRKQNMFPLKYPQEFTEHVSAAGL